MTLLRRAKTIEAVNRIANDHDSCDRVSIANILLQLMSDVRLFAQSGRIGVSWLQNLVSESKRNTLH